jgi:2-polyprenyl-3-methyl-5-hydroxy-6-metoxy-1,4-benzoquinol methylase
LRSISRWASAKNINVELIGFDANPFMIQCALNQSQSYANIQYRVLDIFSPEFKDIKFDIVTLNSICHHFSNQYLLDLYKQLKLQTRLAVIVNDLHRHRISYYAITWLSRISNFSYLAKHDGPLSVLRAFHKNELVGLLNSANITSFQIRWYWAFRWELIIWLL